jgi:Tfp pilus assembly protein PilN
MKTIIPLVVLLVVTLIVLNIIVPASCQATTLKYGMTDDDYDEEHVNTLAVNIAQEQNAKLEQLLQSLDHSTKSFTNAETCEGLCNQTCDAKSAELKVPLATCRVHCISICEDIGAL